MDIQIKQGECLSTAIYNELKNQANGEELKTKGGSIWNAIQGCLTGENANEENTIEHNGQEDAYKVADAWKENTMVFVNDVIHLAETTWNKLLEAVGLNGLTKTQLEKAGLRSTECKGVYYNESNQTHYRYENGQFVEIKPSKDGCHITMFLFDGSHYEKDNDGHTYRVYADGSILNENNYNTDREKLTQNLSQENATDKSKMKEHYAEVDKANELLRDANDLLANVANRENISDDAFIVTENDAQVKIDDKVIYISFDKDTKEITKVCVSTDSTKDSNGNDTTEVMYDSQSISTDTDKTHDGSENINSYDNWGNVKALAIKIFQSKIEGLH